VRQVGRTCRRWPNLPTFDTRPGARYSGALHAPPAAEVDPAMLYSILIYVNEDAVDAMTATDEDDHISRHLQIHEQLAAKGKLGPVVRLMPTSTARQLRTVGPPVVLDGPFAETKEQLLGFYVVDCDSEQEAINVARSLPSLGTIFEVRPVQLYFPGCGLPKTAVERMRA
jgi:hypothetical protein